MIEKSNKPKIFIILAMCIYGTIGIFRKYIPLPSGFLALSRGVIGTVFLLLFLSLKKQKIDICAIKKNLIPLLLSGAMLGVNWMLLFEAYNYTSVATATLCYYMAPVIITVLSVIFFKEKMTFLKFICVAAALLGIVFVSGVLKTGITGKYEIKGILMALASAVLYAAIVITNKQLKDIPALDKTVMQLLISAIVLLPYSLLTENLAVTFTPFILTMLLIVGIVHTGIAYTMYFGNIKNLKMQTVAILSYLDPVIAIILSALILHEHMGVLEIVGAILILGAAFFNEILCSKE